VAAGRKTGGRQRGTPNRATARREAEIAATGITSRDYMMKTLHDETADADDRKGAAHAAAPYVHPRLAATQHTVQGDSTSIRERLERAQARLMPQQDDDAHAGAFDAQKMIKSKLRFSWPHPSPKH
jgi:hypothetical protein